MKDQMTAQEYQSLIKNKPPSRKPQETSEAKRVIGTAKKKDYAITPVNEVENAVATAINRIVKEEMPGSLVVDNGNTFQVTFPEGDKFKITIKKI